MTAKDLYSRSVTTRVKLSVYYNTKKTIASADLFNVRWLIAMSMTRPTVGQWDRCCQTPGIRRRVRTTRTARRPRDQWEQMLAAHGPHTSSMHSWSWV